MAIKRIGVVGSGIMGAGVAEVAAASGFEVVLRSRTQEGADRPGQGRPADHHDTVREVSIEPVRGGEQQRPVGHGLGVSGRTRAQLSGAGRR